MGNIIPPPGSDEALEQGCICPVLDNARGRGVPGSHGKHFWVTGGCPVHASLTPEVEDDAKLEEKSEV